MRKDAIDTLNELSDFFNIPVDLVLTKLTTHDNNLETLPFSFFLSDHITLIRRGPRAEYKWSIFYYCFLPDSIYKNGAYIEFYVDGHSLAETHAKYLDTVKKYYKKLLPPEFKV